MLASIHRYLGDSAPTGRPLLVEARVRRLQAGSFALSLRIRDGEDEVLREFEAAQCPTLADSTALLVALAYDPELEATGGDTNAPRTPKPTAGEQVAHPPQPAPGDSISKDPGEPAAQASVEPADSDPSHADDRTTEPANLDTAPARPLQLLAGIGAALDHGLLPATALGLRAFGETRIARFRLTLSASLWPAQTHALRTPSAGEARATLGAAAFELCTCYELTETVPFGPCLTGRVGALSAETQGISAPQSRLASVLEVGGGLYARFPLSPSWLLAADGRLLSPLRRPRFLVRAGTEELEVHTSASLDLGLSAGIAYVF